MISIRTVVTREILLLLFVISIVLISGTILVEYRTQKLFELQQVQEFKKTVEADQENLMLQILLSKPEDLNLYFSNLVTRFPSILFCADFNPSVVGILKSCDPNLRPHSNYIPLLGNRNLTVRYSFQSKGFSPLIAGVSHSPLLLFAIAACFFVAIYLHVRLGGLLSQPLLATRNAIDLILHGSRLTPSLGDKSVLEWHRIEASLIDLVQYIQRLERAEFEAGQFKTARQVAHDIKSPLSLLRIASEVYKEIPLEKMNSIKSALDRIDEIIETLSVQKPKPEYVDIIPLVNEIVNEKRVTINPKIKLNVEYNCSQTSIEAWADPSQFKRIVSNLLNNSVESMKEGTVTLRLVSGDHFLFLQVLDSGVGIRAPEINQVLEGKSIGKLNGQGLGLSHARKCIEDWGGRINISSAQDMGTIVTVTLRRKIYDQTHSIPSVDGGMS